MKFISGTIHEARNQPKKCLSDDSGCEPYFNKKHLIYTNHRNILLLRRKCAVIIIKSISSHRSNSH